MHTVIFASVHDAVRSKMAETFFNTFTCLRSFAPCLEELSRR
jgi:protein-tyrosine-phosphatase